MERGFQRQAAAEGEAAEILRLNAAIEMQRLELSLSSPAENLALDEALLMEAEQGDGCDEVLRIWESSVPFVVLGRASQRTVEANVDYCSRHNIPILRRTSGGAAVVAGQGCLMYSLVLSMDKRPQLRSIDATHGIVLDSLAAAISGPGRTVHRAGTSDLALVAADRAVTSWQKVSGNSMRRAKNHVLYHGTLLYQFDLELVAKCLRMPPRMPEYRDNRPHGGFVTNLAMRRKDLVESIRLAWPSSSLATWPAQLVGELVHSKYCLASWNERH